MDRTTIAYVAAWAAVIAVTSFCLWRIKLRERIEAREREKLRQKYRDDGEEDTRL